MKSVKGICKLCGMEKQLSFEHVPPRSVFNKHSVEIYDGLEALTREDFFPWETEGLSKDISQKGMGGYYLCRDCNSNTGNWYVTYFSEFAIRLHNTIKNINFEGPSGIEIKVTDIRPLAILKAILVMFCDINNNCFGDERLRLFLLNKKDNTYRLEGYKVFIYLYNGRYEKQVSEIGRFDLKTGKTELVSEIDAYPLGMKLYRKVESDFQDLGVDITEFCAFNYDETANMTIEFPVLQSNTALPNDYRSKDDIFQGIAME